MIIFLAKIPAMRYRATNLIFVLCWLRW